MGFARHWGIGLIGAAAVLAAAAPPARADGLDATDLGLRREALIRLMAEPAGSTESWSNIDSGYQGSLRLLSDSTGADGRTCRQVSEIRQDGSDQATGTLTACRDKGEAVWHVTRQSIGAMAPVPADLGADDQNPPEASQPNGLGNLPVQIRINGNRPGSGTQPGTNTTSTSK
jgi:surface antigen